MISIITAIHNGLEVNRVFYDYLSRYTYYPYELIIIDNASSCGSRDFFLSKGANVITNDGNYSYPHTQNQGIEVAQYDYLCFLNNDITVSPYWDKRLIESMEVNRLDIVSGCGVENMGDRLLTRRYSRKWKRIKNLVSVFGMGTGSLLAMHRLMYGSWEKFCLKRYGAHRHQVVEGIVGNNVVMTRRAIGILGKWDERIQGADFDLFMRSKQRSLTVGDIQPCHIALDVFIHHYIRLTVRQYGKRAAYIDGGKLIDLKEKWTEAELEAFNPDNAVNRSSPINTRHHDREQKTKTGR